ncbi:hypothetical protein AML69_18545 [Escherichia coli]|nr:hypothetical protein AML69_18545 [Escherichia coli]
MQCNFLIYITTYCFLYTFLNVLSGFSTVQIKRIKPSIIYRLLLIGLGSPMVIYGLVRPLTIETRD